MLDPTAALMLEHMYGLPQGMIANEPSGPNPTAFTGATQPTPAPMSPAGGNINAVINSMYGGTGPLGVGSPVGPATTAPAATNLGQGPAAPGNKMPLAGQFMPQPKPPTATTPNAGSPAAAAQYGASAGLGQATPQQVPIPPARYRYLYGGA